MKTEPATPGKVSNGLKVLIFTLFLLYLQIFKDIILEKLYFIRLWNWKILDLRVKSEL